jgi:hypothetical protein
LRCLQQGLLLRALRLQLLNADLRCIQGHAQTHGTLHQQVRRIGLACNRLADEVVGHRVFGLCAGLAQSGQKLLKLVTFCGVHGLAFEAV